MAAVLNPVTSRNNLIAQFKYLWKYIVDVMMWKIVDYGLYCFKCPILEFCLSIDCF